MANNVLASQRHLWDTPIKAATRNSAIPAKQAVQKPRGYPANKAHHSAIPAQAGIQHIKRALRAPLQEWPMKAGAFRPALQCARSALDLRWIPAFTGMAKRRYTGICFNQSIL